MRTASCKLFNQEKFDLLAQYLPNVWHEQEVTFRHRLMLIRRVYYKRHFNLADILKQLAAWTGLLQATIFRLLQVTARIGPVQFCYSMPNTGGIWSCQVVALIMANRNAVNLPNVVQFVLCIASAQSYAVWTRLHILHDRVFLKTTSLIFWINRGRQLFSATAILWVLSFCVTSRTLLSAKHNAPRNFAVAHQCGNHSNNTEF